MHVEVELRALDDPVLKDNFIENVVFIQAIQPLEMAGFAHANHGGGGDNITVFIAGGIRTQEIDNLGHLLAALDLGFGEALCGGTVNADGVGHVDGDNAFDGAGIEQNVSGGMGQQLFCECLNLALFGLHPGLKGRGQNGFFHIHAAQFEHEGCGLHTVIGLAA